MPVETIKPKPKTKQASNIRGWDFTVPFRDGCDHMDIIKLLKDICKSWVFQKEKGNETGYIHWQGRIRLTKPVRLTGIISLLKDTPLSNGHYTPTVNTTFKNENFNYVMKDDTRISGPWKDTDDDGSHYIPAQYAKIDSFYPWQQSLINICNGPAHETEPRSIHLLYDNSGSKGKSTFGLTLFCKLKTALYIPPMEKAEDILNMVFCMENKPIYIIDITKSSGKEQRIIRELYNAVEQIKNGFIYDKRYKFRFKMIDTPHIIVMCNQIPDKSYLSEDRWKIWMIDDENKLIPYAIDNDYET